MSAAACAIDVGRPGSQDRLVRLAGFAGTSIFGIFAGFGFGFGIGFDMNFGFGNVCFGFGTAESLSE